MSRSAKCLEFPFRELTTPFSLFCNVVLRCRLISLMGQQLGGVGQVVDIVKSGLDFVHCVAGCEEEMVSQDVNKAGFRVEKEFFEDFFHVGVFSLGRHTLEANTKTSWSEMVVEACRA